MTIEEQKEFEKLRKRIAAIEMYIIEKEEAEMVKA